jgi:hypothetical protein
MLEEAKTRNNSPSMVKQHRLRVNGEIDLRTTMVRERDSDDEDDNIWEEIFSHSP